MPLIAFTRGSMAASLRLAERISQQLGCTIVTREQVIDHARVYGVEESGLAEKGFMEKHPPHFWDRHTAQRRQYLVFLRASLMDYVAKGNIIYLGHLSQFILAGVPKLLRIRVDASVEYRIRALIEDSGLTEEEAAEHIKEIDEKRTAWAKFLYGVDFASPHIYDMILNMERLSLDSMAQIIECAVRCPEWQVDEETKRQIKDIHLSSIVMAYLARSPRTRGMELAVDCNAESGSVVVRGMSTLVGSKTWEEDIKDVVTGVGGVKSVEILDLR